MCALTLSDRRNPRRQGRESHSLSCAIFTAALSLLGMLSPLAAPAQPLSADQIEKIGIDQKLNEQLPLDLVFSDEEGRRVPLGTYFGQRPVILSLVYYECPMLCTQILNGLVRSMRVLSFDAGREFEVVTVSFDPGETPELAAAKKKEYLKIYGRKGAAAGWHFLTGTQDQIDRLTRAVGFRYQYDKKSDTYLHASGITLLTPEGKLARYFYGVDFAPKDLRLGLVEAAADKIGSAVDQLLLLCFQYDPETGKYGLIIFNSLRVAGVATVVVLGAFVAVLVRRERHKKLSSELDEV